MLDVRNRDWQSDTKFQLEYLFHTHKPALPESG